MNTTPNGGKIVAVSISTSPDLERKGYGQEHLHELMISIARTVLRQDDNLAYGGDLRPDGFTQHLFSLGRGEHREMQGWQGRLYSFLAWPYYLSLGESQEAQLINTCQFVRITPKDAGFDDRPDDIALFDNYYPSPEANYIRARCLTHMRKLMTEGGAKVIDGGIAAGISARIILGGNTKEFSGLMPGIFEEYLMAAYLNIPVYIVGGFGGAADILSKALMKKKMAKELDLRYHYDKSLPLQDLVREYQKHSDVEEPEALYKRLKKCILQIRKRGIEAMENGLSSKENERLMTTENISEILVLLKKGLASKLG
jgi:hypothetical protein